MNQVGTTFEGPVGEKLVEVRKTAWRMREEQRDPQRRVPGPDTRFIKIPPIFNYASLPVCILSPVP